MKQRAVTVQRAEAPATQDHAPKPGHGKGLRSQLRGVGFDEGASLLSPVQQKAEGEKPAAAGDASGDGCYVVQGSWDSFSEWHIELRGGALVDSHTDDLSAADWPTQMTRSGNTLVLVQTTEGSDATITEELVLEVVSIPSGGTQLQAVSATSTFADHTGDGKDVSRRTQTSLPVMAVS